MHFPFQVLLVPLSMTGIGNVFATNLDSTQSHDGHMTPDHTHNNPLTPAHPITLSASNDAFHPAPNWEESIPCTSLLSENLNLTKPPNIALSMFQSFQYCSSTCTCVGAVISSPVFQCTYHNTCILEFHISKYVAPTAHCSLPPTSTHTWSA